MATRTIVVRWDGKWVLHLWNVVEGHSASIPILKANSSGAVASSMLSIGIHCSVSSIFIFVGNLKVHLGIKATSLHSLYFLFICIHLFFK